MWVGDRKERCRDTLLRQVGWETGKSPVAEAAENKLFYVRIDSDKKNNN
jgi:hypothetical protein